MRKDVDEKFKALSHKERPFMRHILYFVLLFLEKLIGMSWTDSKPINNTKKKIVTLHQIQM